MKTDHSPQGYAESLYNTFSGFKCLSESEVKSCCTLLLTELYNNSEKEMKLYYDLAKYHITKIK